MTTIGGLTWRPGEDHSLVPYFATSNPEAITHVLRLAAGGRRVDLGFNRRGGGYAWSLRLHGFADVGDGQECGAAGYGRGMLGSLRDRLHHGMHNPIQAGRHYNIGVRTRVEQSAGQVLVPQFRAPLFDDQEFHFVNHRSEFDFSCRTTDISARCGIPAFEHEEYFAWAHQPEALREFQSGTVHSGPYDGEEILDRTMRVRDVSPHPEDQTPGDLDYSLVVQTIKGLRPPTKFRFLHHRAGGQWAVREFDQSVGTGLSERAATTLGRSYSLVSGEIVRVAKPTMDLPLYVLSTRPELDGGTAIGLMVPGGDLANARQVKVVNRETGQVVAQEDRRTSFNFSVSKTVDASWKGRAFNVMLSRCVLAGLLNPASATAAYGFPALEVVTNKTVVMFGTPAEVMAAGEVL